MDQVFSLKSKQFKKIVENGGKNTGKVRNFVSAEKWESWTFVKCTTPASVQKCSASVHPPFPTTIYIFQIASDHIWQPSVLPMIKCSVNPVAFSETV